MKRMHAAVPLFTAVLATILAVPVVAEEEGFVSLFDGKTLAGWTKAGGRRPIRGRRLHRRACGAGTQHVLCTENLWRLHLQSGVEVRRAGQLRHPDPQPQAARRVVRLPVRVDPSGWSGGIYDDAPRLAVYARREDKEAARKAFKVDD